MGYAKIGIKEDMMILKVKKDELEYRDFVEFEGKYVAIAKNKPCIIKTKNIVSFEDKSYYYDFNGNGSSNKEWHHKILITYTNVDGLRKTLTIELNLKHQNHGVLLNCMNRFVHNK